MDANVQTYCTTLKDLVGEEEPLDILSRTPVRIRTLISGVGAAALSSQPSPGKWSVTEIIAHLADAELVFGYRLRMMFTAPGVRLQAFDPDRFASTFDYASCEAHTSAELFASLRTGTLGMLRRVAPALMNNAGTHEEWGAETVRSLVRLEAGHDKNHLVQIERLLTQVGVTPAFIPSAQQPEIPLDVAERLDLRIGTIVDIVEVPETDRLMKLSVDFGADTRTVIAGIRDERRDPRVLIGRQALFYYNLPRKRIRGQVSEAMLCDVGYTDGIVPALLEPEWPVPNGTRAG
jgi:tRNA-binding protein